MTETLITAESPADVATTVRTVQALLERRGVTLFATIDHAAGARAAGMELADETLLVLGNPRAGTPLMQQDPRVGIELPLRLLVWDDGGTTRIGYADPVDLAQGFALDGAGTTLQRMRELLAGVVAEATSRPAAG
jgi:uncharacterized protein (DUF302 family)